MSRVSLSRFLSVGAGGEADAEIITDASRLRLRGGEIILGRGTNVLASDGGVDGRVIIMRASAFEVCGASVRADGGVTLPSLAAEAARLGLSGLEWACGIPGSIGGGIVMNAGAYGGQLADVLKSVEVATPDGVVRVKAAELTMSYRRTDGLPRGAVISAELGLVPGRAENIKKLMAEYSARRRETQPTGRTFGSAFARVGGKSAGWYIDRAGLKGLTAGGARVSEKHANFIVNEGGSASDIRRLLDTVKLTVYKTFGVRLTEEVRYIGEF